MVPDLFSGIDDGKEGAAFLQTSKDAKSKGAKLTKVGAQKALRVVQVLKGLAEAEETSLKTIESFVNADVKTLKAGIKHEHASMGARGVMVSEKKRKLSLLQTMLQTTLREGDVADASA